MITIEVATGGEQQELKKSHKRHHHDHVERRRGGMNERMRRQVISSHVCENMTEGKSLIYVIFHRYNNTCKRENTFHAHHNDYDTDGRRRHTYPNRIIFFLNVHLL